MKLISSAHFYLLPGPVACLLPFVHYIFPENCKRQDLGHNLVSAASVSECSIEGYSEQQPQPEIHLCCKKMVMPGGRPASTFYVSKAILRDFPLRAVLSRGLASLRPPPPCRSDRFQGKRLSRALRGSSL